jgi:parallel beta-helix repeat protein
MKFCLFLIYVGWGTIAALATQSTPTIYLSARTDGLPGSGTQADPINVSTTALFDGFFKARYLAHYVNYTSSDPVNFHLAAGHYATKGIIAVSGWSLLGAGQNSTVITLTGLSYGTSTIKYVSPVQAIAVNGGSSNIQVKNLTVDGGTRATGIPLAAGFTMPLPRQSVTMAVTDSSRMNIGRWYYVQDTAMTNGIQKWWGIVTCTGITGNNVTLQNAEVPTAGSVTGDTTAGSPVIRNISSTANLEEGQVVSGAPFGTLIVLSVDSSTQITLTGPAQTTSNQVHISYSATNTDNVTGPVLPTADLFPAGSRGGIALEASNITVQDVTVQDVAVPFYEGWAGIALNKQAIGAKVGSNNLIDHCTVRDMFGIYSAYISAVSANNYTGNDGTTEQVTVSNNTVSGNGYYTGIEFAGNSSSKVTGNTVSNVGTGFFCDTGYSTGISITKNSFSGRDGIHIGIGAPSFFNNSSIENNVITLTANEGVGIGLEYNESNITVSHNTITLQSATNGAYGISLTNMTPGTKGNTVTANTIVSTLQNFGIDASQNTIVTYSQINQQKKSGSSSSGPAAVKSSGVVGGPESSSGAAIGSALAVSSGSITAQAQATAAQIEAQTTQMAQAAAASDSSGTTADEQEKQLVEEIDALAQQMAAPGSPRH